MRPLAIRLSLLGLLPLLVAAPLAAQTRAPAAPPAGATAAQPQGPQRATGRQDNAQPIEINADSLDVQQDQKVAVFKGNVDAVQGDLRVKCDTLRVIYSEAPRDQAAGTTGRSQGRTTINRLEAFGNVFVSKPDQTGRGERGVYDLDTRIIVLEGNVVLTDKENVVKGARATWDLNTRQSTVERGSNSRVQGVFLPKQGN